MKPTVRVATSETPDGREMNLYRHDRDFVIRVDGEDLMLSRHHESELELARLGCAHLPDRKQPRVLVGGLGMGYTLRQALDMLGPDAEVVVGELMAAVGDWNRDFLGVLNGYPLADSRVKLEIGDIVGLVAGATNRFDAILLDVDNGPSAMSYSGNSRLYSDEGIWSCRNALRRNGCLAVWSAGPSKEFEQLLMRCGFQVSRSRVPVYRASKSQSRFIWVASEDRKNLPASGDELALPGRYQAKKKRLPV